MTTPQNWAAGLTQHLIVYHCGKVKGCKDFINCNVPDWAEGENLWLGQGMYFWDNTGSAEAWCVKRNQLSSIVAADICLDHMIDLTDPSQRYGIGLVVDRASKSFFASRHKDCPQYFGDISDFFPEKPPYSEVVGQVDVVKAVGTHAWEGSDDRSFADMCWKDDPHLIFNASVEYCVKNKSAIGKVWLIR